MGERYWYITWYDCMNILYISLESIRAITCSRFCRDVLIFTDRALELQAPNVSLPKRGRNISTSQSSFTHGWIKLFLNFVLKLALY